MNVGKTCADLCKMLNIRLIKHMKADKVLNLKIEKLAMYCMNSLNSQY